MILHQFFFQVPKNIMYVRSKVSRSFDMYIGLLCSVLFLQPGFEVAGLEAVDEDKEVAVTVSPVWDKDSGSTSRTDTCGKDMPSEFEEDPKTSLGWASEAVEAEEVEVVGFITFLSRK